MHYPLKPTSNLLKITLHQLYYSKAGHVLHHVATHVIRIILLSPLWLPIILPIIGTLKHVFFFIVLFTWPVLFDLVLPLLACGFAVMIMLARNPMHSLLSLLGVFFSTLLFYVASGIEFVGIVFLIVYVGAVAVLFLFVIMLLNVKSLTSKEKLVRHISQVAAMFGVTLLYAQLQTRTINLALYVIAESRAASAKLEPTSGEAVFQYVRFQANDINLLASLYTEHGAIFLIITFTLLSALVGAIVLATATTERAVSIADIRTVQLATVPLIFVSIVLPSTGVWETYMVTDASFTWMLHNSEIPLWAGLMSVYDVRNIAVNVEFFSDDKSDIINKKLKKTKRRIFRRHKRAVYVRRAGRRRPCLWLWRSARAKSLYRVTKIATPVMFGQKTHLPGEPTWERKVKRRRSIINPIRLGFVGYIKGILYTRVAPWLVYWSWRTRSFTHLFCIKLIFIPHVVVLFYWFYNDLDESLTQLTVLYDDTYLYLKNRVYGFTLLPEITRCVPVVILLWPAAALKVVLNYFWWVVFASAAWADTLTNRISGRYEVGEDYESNCITLKNFTDDTIEGSLAESAEERITRLRHPDKDHSNFGPLPVLIVAPTVNSDSVDTQNPVFSTCARVYNENILAPLTEWLHYLPVKLIWLFTIFIIFFFLHSVAELLLTIFWTKLYKKIPRPPTFILRTFTYFPLSTLLLITFLFAQPYNITTYVWTFLNNYTRLDPTMKGQYVRAWLIVFSFVIGIPLALRLAWNRREAHMLSTRPWGARTWYNYFISDLMPKWLVISELERQKEIMELVTKEQEEHPNITKKYSRIKKLKRRKFKRLKRHTVGSVK